MKKRFVFFSSFLMLVLICFLCNGCNGDRKITPLQNWMKENGKLKVLSTIQMIGDLVQEIGKERVENIVLIEGELDPHTYELVKGDDEKLNRADLIFYNGLGLEHGLSLSHFLKAESKAIALGDKVMKAHPKKILSLSKTLDPHIWMDVSLWSALIDPIKEELSRIDPESENYYLQNANFLKKALMEIHQDILKLMTEIPADSRYLVTSHDAFNYFARAYLAQEKSDWQQHFTAPEGLAPEGQLSVLDIKRIIDYLKEHNVKVIFPESNVSQDSLKKIVDCAEKMGLKVEIANDMLYGDAGCKSTKEEISYIKMMRHNAETIHRYLRVGPKLYN